MNNLQDKVFRQEISVRDARFDIEALRKYRLFISVGDDSVRCNVVDSTDNRCVWLEDYRFFGRVSSAQEIIAGLNGIYDSDMFLRANYWLSVAITQRNLPFVLVPDVYWDASLATDYLAPTADLSPQMSVQWQHNAAWQLHTVFALDTELLNWFAGAYPGRNLQYIHQAHAFLAGVYQMPLHNTTWHLLIEPNYFIIAVVHKGKLMLCNAYPYRSTNDFLYFVLALTDELGLSRDQDTLKLYGKINPVSEIYKGLKQYFRNVQIYDKKPDGLVFNADFDEVPNMYYFDLYAMNECIEP